MSKMIKFLFLFALYLALCAQAPAKLYPWDLIKDPDFKRVYVKTINPYAQGEGRWLKELKGPSNPAKAITIGSDEYLFLHSCKIHNCNTDNIVILYNRATKHIYAKLFTKGEYKILGQPSTPILDKLNELYRDTFGETSRAEPTENSKLSGRYPTTANARSQTTGTGVSVGEFFTAIDKGNVEVVKTYIRLGNDIKVKSDKGYSALAFLFRSIPYKGSKTSQEKIAGLLLDAGASVNETIPVEVNPSNVPVFVWAVHTGNEAIVDLFIRRGVNKEARIEGLFSAVGPYSPAYINICKRILDSGIDINSRDRFGQTPLFLVGSVGMAKYLVSRGADVNAKDDDGKSVLGWLSSSSNETDQRIISYLVSKGAKKNR